MIEPIARPGGDRCHPVDAADFIMKGQPLSAHRDAAQTVMSDWERRLLVHAERFGTQLSPGDSELLWMLLEGAWILGRIQQSKEPVLHAADTFLSSSARVT